MRSFREIRFRVGQELGNLRLWLFPSAAMRPCSAGSVLPDPDSFRANLAGTVYAGTITETAESILRHRFPMLGEVVETGPGIRWRRDYGRGIETGLDYFRRIPYLDAAAVGDHKIIWELNRHQHLIVLAQAWRLTGRREFLDEIPRQIESWWEQNPFLRGINWVSALEIAFRALSWIWILHLCGDALAAGFRRRLSTAIGGHGAYLENNLSVYFSPNTHLLGEAVALHAIGTVFSDHPRAVRWRQRGGEVVAAEMMRQVRRDGSHFEQSSAYHVYALDFFLFHALLAVTGPDYREKLRKMADYLDALRSADGWIPLLGDDDGGNLFHPYGVQRRYAGRTLATCRAFFEAADWSCTTDDSHFQAAWWTGARAFREPPPAAARSRSPQLFADAKVAVLSSAPAHVVVDVRAFGHAGAGHSHAHALSVVCRYAGEDLLIDPGTYTYTGEPEWRARFRGTAFHNTVRVDGADQAGQAGPFRWNNVPNGAVLHWAVQDHWCYLHAACEYRDIRHERYFVWLMRSETLVVVDVVKSAGGGERRIEQFWHCGCDAAEASPGVWRIGKTAVLAGTPPGKVRVESGGIYGWSSEAPGRKTPGSVIIREQTTRLPALMGAVLFLKGEEAVVPGLEVANGRIILRAGENRRIELPESGDPMVEWN